MSSELAKAVANAKKTLAQLTLQLEKSRKGLGGLHKKFGFSSIKELINELRSPGDAPKVKGKEKPKAEKASSGPATTKKRGKRTRITPEIKNRVKAAVKAGKTGAAIAKELKISVPSVHNIKKELGLVRSRK